VDAILVDTSTTLESSIAGVASQVTTVDSVVDGLATSLTTIEGKIDVVDSVCDNIEIDTQSIESKTDIIDGLIDTMVVNLATVDGIVDAILVDTNELQTDWANGGRLDVILDSAAGSASILPISSSVPAGEVSEQEITQYVDTSDTMTIAVYDSDDNPIDLSGVTELRFVVFTDDDDRTNIYTLTQADMSITGASNNQVAITYDEADTASEGTYRWNLRDEDQPRLLGHGTLKIIYSTGS